jgi:hypothetical protein
MNFEFTQKFESENFTKSLNLNKIENWIFSNFNKIQKKIRNQKKFKVKVVLPAAASQAPAVPDSAGCCPSADADASSPGAIDTPPLLSFPTPLQVRSILRRFCPSRLLFRDPYTHCPADMSLSCFDRGDVSLSSSQSEAQSVYATAHWRRARRSHGERWACAWSRFWLCAPRCSNLDFVQMLNCRFVTVCSVHLHVIEVLNGLGICFWDETWIGNKRLVQ